MRYSITPSLHHSITPSLHHSITPSLHHSITPSLHHSITPSLHHSITPSLHHSVTPSPHLLQPRAGTPDRARPPLRRHAGARERLHHRHTRALRRVVAVAPGEDAGAGAADGAAERARTHRPRLYRAEAGDQHRAVRLHHHVPH